MHNAPPVVYPVGRFVVGRWWLVALCLLSAAGLIVWQIQSQVTSFTWWAAWICWGGCGVSAAIWIPRQALTEGRLGWSGESWFWQADDASDQPFLDVNISVSLDTGQGLLLWVQPLDEQGKAQGRLRSTWLQAGAMPSKWHGFRCAVYSRPMTSALAKQGLNARL